MSHAVCHSVSHNVSHAVSHGPPSRPVPTRSNYTYLLSVVHLTLRNARDEAE